MIGIIDYGAGNTKSVMNALDRLNVPYFLSDEVKELRSADKLILPGVGHAKKAMQQLQERQLIPFIQTYEKPFLGVCLGMQLLASFTEEGNTKCLGILEDQVKFFSLDQEKVPKMGWNTIQPSKDVLMKNIPDTAYFYFVHSYYLPSSSYSIAEAEYGIKYTAAVRKKNFWGVQFHPEKSASSGALILQNFINL